MRTRKVSAEAFQRAVESGGSKCGFVRIPSSKEGIAFSGILMADGVWVSWPIDLDDELMAKYIDLYGNIPDRFELHPERAAYMASSPDSKFKVRVSKDEI